VADARTINFDDGSSDLDPFETLAPTPLVDQARREAAIREWQRDQARKTGNTNMQQDPAGRTAQGAGKINPKTGDLYTGDERPETASFGDQRFFKESLDTIQQHPWLPLLPLAPLAMGAIAPGAAGAGSISTAGGAAPYVSSAAPAMGEAFTMASPYAATGGAGAAGAASAGAGAAGTAGAAGAAAGGAAEKTLGSMVGEDVGKWAPGLVGAALPIVANEVLGGRTPEQKRLLETQEQIAKEAEERQFQQQNQRMNSLGQQLLALNPTNQMMANMFGPSAAFTPESMAQMVQGPPPTLDPALVNYQGTDPAVRAKVDEYLRRKREYDANEASRRDMMMGGIQQPGAGPAPIQMPTPQAARRF